MHSNFGDYFFSLLLGPLKRARKAVNQFHIFCKVMGSLFDDTKADIFRLREQAMVYTAHQAVLQEHGKDRAMPRLAGESLEGYRKRLAIKAELAEKAGTKAGILLALEALGYDRSVITPMYEQEPRRWAEFVVTLGSSGGTGVKDLSIVYNEIMEVKQASGMPAWLEYTPPPTETGLFLGVAATGYREQMLNKVEDIALPTA